MLMPATLSLLLAAVMLVAGGDDPSEALSGLQRITIISAVPSTAMRSDCGAGALSTARFNPEPAAMRRRRAASPPRCRAA